MSTDRSRCVCELLTRAPSAASVCTRPLAGDGIGSYFDSRSIFSIAVKMIASEQEEAEWCEGRLRSADGREGGEARDWQAAGG